MNSIEKRIEKSDGVGTTSLPYDEAALQPVPFFSTARVNALYNLEDTLKGVLNSHNFVLGEEVKGFEREFADFCGTHYAIGVGNGTDALELSLRALGIGPGKKVVTVANAGFYTSTAALATGATLVYVDVSATTRTMCPLALNATLTQQACDCVVVTHLFGQLADMGALKSVTDSYDIPIIEDCAQAHGAQRSARRAGSVGTIGAFSFYPTKNLGALGDGGAITTSDKKLAIVVQQLRQYGWKTKYHVDIPGGMNSRLDEIQAAVLRTKLPHLDDANTQRIKIGAQYNAAFSDIPVQCPLIQGRENVSHLYVIETAFRTELRRHLTRRGIQTAIHYPLADYAQKVNDTGALMHLPQTEHKLASVVSLPCYPGMPESDIGHVIHAVCAFYAGQKANV